MAAPPDLAAWLRELSLEAQGARLVADHKLAFLCDVRDLDESKICWPLALLRWRPSACSEQLPSWVPRSG